MNPFLSEYDTPFGVPPFDIIENEHFIPAYKEGISQQEAEIEAIVQIRKHLHLKIPLQHSI